MTLGRVEVFGAVLSRPACAVRIDWMTSLQYLSLLTNFSLNFCSSGVANSSGLSDLSMISDKESSVLV